jgi:hypothetical protein
MPNSKLISLVRILQFSKQIVGNNYETRFIFWDTTLYSPFIMKRRLLAQVSPFPVSVPSPSYRADKVCDTKLCSGGVLINVFEAVSGVNRISDFECFEECVWVEVAMTDERNLLIGNHYFSPHITVDIIKICNIFFF